MLASLYARAKRFDFMIHRKLWFGISGVLLIPGLIAMILCQLQFGSPVKLGIDFTGGTLAQFTFTHAVTAAQVRHAVGGPGAGGDVQVQIADGKTALIRTKAMDPPARARLMQALKQDLGSFRADRFESVGPAVGQEVLGSALTALGLTMLGICAYVGLRYQLDFALAAIAALAHDVAFLLGTFALLGLTLGIEVDGLFVTAVLTVVGFSVHDTIVVFDRLRETMRRAGPRDDFGSVANRAIGETFARSVNTSLTVCLTLLAMAVLGGEPVRWFSLAMLLGVGIGTYSSIFNAAQLLAWWRMRKLDQRQIDHRFLAN